MTFEDKDSKTLISQERKLKAIYSSVHSNIFECLPCAVLVGRCWRSRADVQSPLMETRAIAHGGRGGGNKGEVEAWAGACSRRKLLEETAFKLKVKERGGASQVKGAMRRECTPKEKTWVGGRGSTGILRKKNELRTI